MTDDASRRLNFNRRTALKLTAGASFCATLLTQPAAVKAQTTSDISALNLMLNVEYLIAQFLATTIGEVVPADRIAGNGLPGVSPINGRSVAFADPLLRATIVEMAADNRNHLFPIRVIVGASAARQPLMDLSAKATAPFSVAMQRAGVVAPGAAFDPYASEENLLYALFYLKGVSVAAYRGLASGISNRVVLQSFAGLLATESIHAATVRHYIYARGAVTPRLRTNADAIAAFQRSLNGGNAYQGISPSPRTYPGGAAAMQIANMAPILSDGDVGGRTSGQILNQLYLTSAAATSGGFFPDGVNGSFRTSASA